VLQRALAIILLCLTAVALVGVNQGLGAEKVNRVVFTYGAINAYTTPIWIAKEQGLFRKHGLDVQPVFIIAGRGAQAMMAGEVDVGLIGPTHVANAVAGGSDMVMFMGIQNRVRYVFIARSTISRPEDLKGKKLAIGTPSGLASLSTYASLDFMGLSPRRDHILLLQVGEEPQRLAALQSGSVDGTLVNPEIASAVSSKGYVKLLDMAQANIPFQSSAIVTTRKILRAKPEVVENVAKSQLDAIAYIFNPANKKSVVQTIARGLRLRKPERAEAAYSEILEEIPRKPYPSMSGISAVLKVMAQVGLNPKVAQLKAEDLVDLSLMKRLDESGYIDSLYSSNR